MKTVSLTFDRDHTHAGQPIKRGQIVPDMPQSAADWLIAQNVAHLTPAATRMRVARTEAPEDTHATGDAS